MVRSINGNGYNKTLLERISFRLTEWVGTPFSLTLHALFLIGIFSLRYLGIISDDILLVLFSALILEAFILSVFTQITIKKTANNLKGIEEELKGVQEGFLETEKSHRLMLYIGHQVKTLQQDVNALRKSVVLKTAGNGQHRKAHA